MKIIRAVGFIRLALLATLVAFSGVAISQDDISLENAHERFKKLGKRGSELFAIATPGETYNEITGAIGHSAVDMSISGNGVLGFDVRREFQSRPGEYPYDLGTMSLRIPHISFEAFSSTIGPAMTCSQWESEGGEVFNDIQLQSLGGNVSLIHKMQVSAGARSLYPTDAQYISKDNWVLDCVNDEYRARSPDGTTYYFDANKGAEHILRNRWIANLNGGTNGRHAVFTQYKIYVDRIERLNSSLLFFYTAPQPTTGLNSPFPPEQNYRARPPMHFSSTDGTSTGSIHNKRRLVRVELRAGNENAANGATENQFIYFTYKSLNASCPGLLESVHSTTTTVSKVRYWYDFVQGGVGTKDISAPATRCVLERVDRNAAVSPSSSVFKRTWSFEYGAVGSQTPYYLPASQDRGHWWQYYAGGVSSLPLHSVTTPTGAKTTYEYNTGYVCDYQDSHDSYSDNPASACTSAGIDNRVRTPIVKKRTVSGDDIITQNTTFHYARIDATYRVERKIQNEETIQRLVFGRINHTKVPTGRLDQETKEHQYVDSNQLMVYELLDATNPSTPALVSMTNFYKEGLHFPIEFTTRLPLTTSVKTAPPGSQLPGNYASWHKNRSMYMFNSRRVNLIRTVTTIDGNEYETKYNAFDFFNNPTAIAEIHRVNNVATQRNIALSYDNDYASKNGYILAGLKYKQTTSGESHPLIESYAYNANGQLSTKTVAGFKTSYSYHANGNVHQVIDGRNKFERRTSYTRGIPKNITDRDGKSTTRTMDGFGNVTSETDPDGVKQTYSINNNDFYKRVSRLNINTTGNKYTDRTYSYAQYTDSGSAGTYKTDRESVAGKYFKLTRYDSLGRVKFTLSQDRTGPTVNRIQRFTYDKLGRLKFKGQVRNDWSVAHGTHYEYDNYGRIKNVRYPFTSSPAIQYCYGPNCAGNFAAAGPVKDGYAMRDQLGYVTVHNYRSFGSPANKELVEIRQEIRPSAWSIAQGDGQDDVVVTTINRNKVGFINSVKQKGSNSTELTRTYVPHAAAGSTTFLVKSETHPEFANQKSYQYDQNGNVTKMTNYNNAITNYVYDPMDRLRYAQNPGANGATAGVPTTEYRYSDNGNLTDVIQGNRAWHYNYTDINLLKDEQLTIGSESFLIEYDHDNYAQVDSITYPGGRVVDYVKSGFGQAKSVAGFATGIQYHPNGMASVVDFENGTKFTSTQDTYQRPSTWRTEDDSASAYFNFVYQYDVRSNITGINNYFPPNGGSLTNLEYDGLNRLTRADATGLWGVGRFSYDPIGNIKKKFVGGNNRTYIYGSENRLDSVVSNQPLANYVMSYDDNGNVTDTSLADYQFDQLNRLVRSDDGTAILDNTYDGHNMRVKGMTTRDGQVSTTYYIYNRAGQLLHELDSETGETRDHIQLNGRTIATIGSHNFVDSDNDGMPDYFERQHGLNVNANDAMLDDDNDGRSNLVEYMFNHLPTDPDTDNDGIPDGQDSELPPFIPMLEQPGGVDLTPIYQYLLE